MGKSGNPARRAEEMKISQVGDFKNRMGGVVTLPSGLTVRVKNPGGLRAFMGSDIMPNSLMTIIQKSMKSGKAPSEKEATAALMNENGEFDESTLDKMNKMLDAMALRTIVEPRIHRALTEEDLQVWNDAHPEEQLEDVEDLRQDDILYIDEIPDDDKQFIFQWISGGTKDLETFRRKYDERVAAVAAQSVLGDDAK